MENGQNGADGGKEKALRSGAAGRVYGKHSGFRNLKAYQVAVLLYDFTCRFCARYVPDRDRHYDQMVQAARSGYQNLGEGSEDSATSKKLEMNLTNVARSSLGEERAANLGAVLAAQAHWLAERLMDRQARDFEAGGGFAERLYAARTAARENGRDGQNGQSRQNGTGSGARCR